MPKRIKYSFPIRYRVEKREMHGEGHIPHHREKDTGQVGRSCLPLYTYGRSDTE